jgi:hypothetical protein
MPVVWPVSQPRPRATPSGWAIIPPPLGPTGGGGGTPVNYTARGYTGSSGVGIFFVLTQSFQGVGYTGSLGQAAFSAAGGGATHRALGNGLIVTEKWVPRLSGLTRTTRALGVVAVTGRSLQPAALARARVQGDPVVVSRVYPPGLQHARAIPAPEIIHATLQLVALDRV